MRLEIDCMVAGGSDVHRRPQVVAALLGIFDQIEAEAG